ncbi:Protein male abnormal 7 [Dirofilaria immitis]|nr:Protein male abnormal 7 [Dirofilaria immitis]
MFQSFFVIFVIKYFCQILAQSKEPIDEVIHFCDPSIPNDCGAQGKCMRQLTGNRCRCPIGRMGIMCRRPCQDIYKSCIRWKEEDRCQWAKPILPFFEDNCAESCGLCQSNDRSLNIPLPPILEPISWIIGRWETETLAGDRFPVSFEHPYKEILDISLSEVPMFDRPPVNVSIRAYTNEGSEYNEVGFMTGKPLRESTGFQKQNDSSVNGNDQVAIEMISNTGIITIEEGMLYDGEIFLTLKYKYAIPTSAHYLLNKKSKKVSVGDEECCKNYFPINNCNKSFSGERL